jgi:ribosomal protein S9
MEANNVSGKGTIEHLILKTTTSSCKFNMFKPSTWFNNNSVNISVNGVSISVDGDLTIENGKVFVNGKELEQTENKEEQTWEVPKNIKIKRITTKMIVISDYDIAIDGGGKLQKKVAFL